MTSKVTAETLRLHRGLAVQKHRHRLRKLARHMSISSRHVPPPDELTQWIDEHRPFPSRAAYIEERYAVEPYRLVLSLLRAYLTDASCEDMESRLLERTPQHQPQLHLRDLLEPLEIITECIPESLLEGDFFTIQDQPQIFGLHSVRLDIREDSERLNSALGEILRALKIASDFEQLPNPERIALLTNLLLEPIPELSYNPGATTATTETWALLQLIGRA